MPRSSVLVISWCHGGFGLLSSPLLQKPQQVVGRSLSELKRCQTDIEQTMATAAVRGLSLCGRTPTCRSNCLHILSDKLSRDAEWVVESRHGSCPGMPMFGPLGSTVPLTTLLMTQPCSPTPGSRSLVPHRCCSSLLPWSFRVERATQLRNGMFVDSDAAGTLVRATQPTIDFPLPPQKNTRC
ncbi:hypothetical protein VTK26DRAFT_9218 [Humicola hyalothermophila]